MKTKLFAIILSALTLCILGGFTLGGSGARDYYAGLLGEGIITEAEFEKLVQCDFELPESERQPIEDFSVGEITTRVIAE
ncbi:hypothetical protein [Harryflintia acetispora]|uniref:hypothetical protein n=1 Tax=Harryflintia acetispora TaxID=1849041 RepID=UPI00189B5BDA|nr:hypothetical protein [Harryflintia acetispora]